MAVIIFGVVLAFVAMITVGAIMNIIDKKNEKKFNKHIEESE